MPGDPSSRLPRRKVLLRSLLGLSGVLILVVFWAWARGRSLPARSVDGPLAGPAHAWTGEVGPFTLRWQPDRQQLELFPRTEPGRILWSNEPGRAFLAAGDGQESVEEHRGLFDLRDRLLTPCTRQRLDSLVQTDVGISLGGSLACADGRSVPWVMTWRGTGPRQLELDARVTSPGLDRLILSFSGDPEAKIWGLGQQFTHIDLQGRAVPIITSEQGIGRGLQPLTLGADLTAGAGGSWHHSYAPVPHFLTDRGRSFFLTGSEAAIFDFRRGNRIQVRLLAPRMVARVQYGDGPTDLVESYTRWAGRMKPLPEWMNDGAVIGMQGGTAEVRRVLELLDRHRVPVAAFWLQDWVGRRTTTFGEQLWWSWTLDEDRYPGWDELVSDLRARDIRVLTYVNPFLVDTSEAPTPRRNLFAEARAAGYLVKTDEGEPYLIPNTSFSAGLVDLSSPEAQRWLEEILRTEVLGRGVSGWMADFGEALPWDAVLASGEPAPRLHNRYPELWAELNRRVVDRAEDPEKLVFFTRSGFSRSPRWSRLFWLGDQLVSWDRYDGMKSAIVGLLSGGFSGFTLNHSDVGGYTTVTHPVRDYHRSKELLLRWMELAAFTPVFRTHEGNLPRANAQPWDDTETLEHLARCTRIYRAWRDYRRRLMDEAYERGLPLARHPVLVDDSPELAELTWQQFFVGTELLVAPVADPGIDEVEVVLPPGRWVHLWTGEVSGDPDSVVRRRIEAPLGSPAVFYRQGSKVGSSFVSALRLEGIAVPDPPGGQPGSLTGDDRRNPPPPVPG